MEKLRRLATSLRGKIFTSHLLVLTVGIGALVAGVNFVAPAFFQQHMRFMMRGPGMGRMMQEFGMPPPASDMPGNYNPLNTELSNALTSAFLSALHSALWVSAALGIIAAMLASAYVSSRITRRMRDISHAASHIAAGHFHERLTQIGNDELAVLASDFNRMAESLENAEERRMQLIGDVAHELRTPLTTVEGYMEGFIDGVMPATAETFQLVQKEAERLRRLVNDLQQLSRAEAGAEPITPQALQPTQCVEQAIARVEPLFQEKRIHLTTNYQSPLPLVRADADRTLQVLLNLLSNALHYTPTNGSVQVRVTALDNEVCFQVADSGIGIAPADLPHVFERFYRTDRSRSRSSGGSGLGLAISRHLILAQKGHIWAESAGVEQGSIFYFTLPIWNER